MGIIEDAIRKLEKEREKAKEKGFVEPITEYLIKRCTEDSGFAEDVMQSHKTWGKCFNYIYGKAKKRATGSCAAVRDDVVFEWAEDYYRKDDKEEEAKAAEKRAKAAEERAKAAEERKNPVPEVKKEEVEVKEEPKPVPKKDKKQIEGQMDLSQFLFGLGG